MEYAEAVAEIQTALKEAFDYTPTVEFVEKYMGSLEKVALGNTSAITELQSAIAEDMVKNLEIKIPLEGIDTSLIQDSTII
jgi:hypothetical protein